MVMKNELNKINLEPAKAHPSSTPTSGSSKKMKKFKGVRMRSWGSWVSEIRAPNQKTRIWLGSYSTAEAAARAYDAALLCLKGPSASLNLNFPIPISSQNSLNNFNSHNIMSPKSIQRVAAAAANSFLDQNAPIITTTSTSTTTTNIHNNPSPQSPPTLAAASPSSSWSSITSSSDDVSLVSCFGSFDTAIPYEVDEPMSMLNNPTWYNFDSPKYTDMLLNGVFFDPPMIEDVEEEGVISLWNFC